MSINPEILELIHAEIDGVATASEQARLRDVISRNSEAREEYRRLRGLFDVLGQVEPAAPPPQLAGNVMREVRARRDAMRLGITGRIRAFLPSGRLAIRYAYAVAAGAVLGVVGLHSVSGGSFFGPAIPERDARATIAPYDGIRRLDLGPAGVRGVATLQPSASGNAIGLDLDTTGPVELVLRYDPVADGGRVDVSVVKDGEATKAGSMRLSRKN
jgi:hypothetical protein